jgi:hypothetical protein
MLRLIRKAVARYHLLNARQDVRYWRSAIEIATAQHADAVRRVARLEQVPNELDFPLPKALRARGGT